MNPQKRQFTLDSAISCLGLASLVLVGGAALGILAFCQILPWLRFGTWNSYPLGRCWDVQTSWVGLQQIIDWLLALPVTLALALLAIALFWLFGFASAKIYQWASRVAPAAVTPSQTRA